MSPKFTVDKTMPTVYLNNANQAVSGFIVFVTFPEFDETHEVKVPNLAEKTVNDAIQKLYDQRVKLANLGKST